VRNDGEFFARFTFKYRTKNGEQLQHNSGNIVQNSYRSVKIPDGFTNGYLLVEMSGLYSRLLINY
jgi:hypothetical protein